VRRELRAGLGRLTSMKRLMAVAIILAAAAAAIGLSYASEAATAEDTYFAARDAAIAKIKSLNKPAGPTAPVDQNAIAEDDRAIAALTPQMRAIVGPVAIKGMTDEGTINIDTLNEGDEGFGILDGMVYGGLDAKTRVIVTTDSLFRHWLREHQYWWGKESGEMPQEMSVAVKESTFYTQAILTDAAVMLFAELPVRKPAGAVFAFAMLGARSQSETPPVANEIFIALAQGGHVFIATTSEISAVGPIAACDAVRNDLVKQSIAAAEEAGLDEKARRKKSDDLSGKSETEFLRCFAQRAAREKGFAAATQAAQALIDRLPGAEL
jgi:hypothetical protein